MKELLPLCWTAVVLLVACKPTVSITIPQGSATPVSALMFTLTPGSTPTAIVTSIPELTTNALGVKEQCLEIETSFRQVDTPPVGTIILDDFGGLSTLTLPNNDLQSFFSDNPISDAAISPDGKWLAYITSDKSFAYPELLHITTMNGQRKTSIPVEPDWNGLGGWLDNERLIVLPKNRSEGTVVVVNPFAGKWHELLPPFPDVYNTYPPARWGVLSLYNPALTQAVYLRYDKQGNISAVLWDVLTKREIWHITHWGIAAVKPEWSPDGIRFAIAVPVDVEGYHSELFIVRSDGQAAQMTNLAGSYPFAIIFSNFSWSPDGRYIAFWLDSRQYREEESPEHLLVLDTTTQQVTDVCITGNVHVSSFQPIWSPTSHQLAIANFIDENAARVLIVDIIAGYAVQVTEVKEAPNLLIPVGWMPGK